MSRLYTCEEIRSLLKELRIKPKTIEGDSKLLLTAREVIDVYNWRARFEYACEYTYNRNVIAKHINKEYLTPYYKPGHERNAMFDLEEVLAVPLSPARGASLRRVYQQKTYQEKQTQAAIA